MKLKNLVQIIEINKKLFGYWPYLLATPYCQCWNNEIKYWFNGSIIIINDLNDIKLV